MISIASFLRVTLVFCDILDSLTDPIDAVLKLLGGFYSCSLNPFSWFLSSISAWSKRSKKDVRLGANSNS